MPQPSIVHLWLLLEIYPPHPLLLRVALSAEVEVDCTAYVSLSVNAMDF
jgi:hypothetical protein